MLFAGDLVETDAPPYFGDGYPLDWPATVERMVELVTGAVVPGHGTVGDRAFAVRSMIELRTIAELATLVDRACSASRGRPSDAYPADRRASRSSARWPSCAASWT